MLIKEMNGRANDGCTTANHISSLLYNKHTYIYPELSFPNASQVHLNVNKCNSQWLDSDSGSETAKCILRLAEARTF